MGCTKFPDKQDFSEKSLSSADQAKSYLINVCQNMFVCFFNICFLNGSSCYTYCKIVNYSISQLESMPSWCLFFQSVPTVDSPCLTGVEPDVIFCCCSSFASRLHSGYLSYRSVPGIFTRTTAAQLIHVIYSFIYFAPIGVISRDWKIQVWV